VRADIDLAGARELESLMAELPDGLRLAVFGDATAAMARVVAKSARSMAPVDTGALKASIRARRMSERVRGRKVASAAAVFAGGEGARHAALVEFGRAGQAANPYLRRAVTSDRARQHGEFARKARVSLEKYLRLAASASAASNRRLARLISL